jgi:hypothetical protein
MATTPWWVQVVSALVSVSVGFALSEMKGTLSRRRKLASYWSALRFEAEFASARAKTYLIDKAEAPLSRASTSVYETCFSELLSEGSLTAADSAALMAFYSEIETFNRGLDRVASAEGSQERQREYLRNRLKAERLIEDAALYSAAIAAIERHANAESKWSRFAARWKNLIQHTAPKEQR